MPFMYHGNLTNIERDIKREDSFLIDTIHDALLELARMMSRSGVGEPTFHFQLLDNIPNQKPKIVLVPSLIERGLNTYEIEHWLDNLSIGSSYTYAMMNGDIDEIDQRKWYYQELKNGGTFAFIKTGLLFRPSFEEL